MTDDMLRTLSEAEAIWREEYALARTKVEHLPPWPGVKWTWGRLRHAYCGYNPIHFGMSKHYAQHVPREMLVDTIRHEIAHAAAGPGHGHGRVWAAWCGVVGARPERCKDAKAHLPPRELPWTLVCEGCGGRWPRKVVKPGFREGKGKHKGCGKIRVERNG